MGIDEEVIHIVIENQRMNLKSKFKTKLKTRKEKGMENSIEIEKNLKLQWKLMKSWGGWRRQTNGKYRHTHR